MNQSLCRTMGKEGLHFFNEAVVDKAERGTSVHDGGVGSTRELLSIDRRGGGRDLPEALAAVYVGVVDAGFGRASGLESILVDEAKCVEALHNRELKKDACLFSKRTSPLSASFASLQLPR